MTDPRRGRSSGRIATAAAVAVVLVGASACRTSNPAPDVRDAVEAATSPDLRAVDRLRRDAQAEGIAAADVTRPALLEPIALPLPLPKAADPRPAVEAIARRRLDLAIAPTVAIEDSGRASRDATRLYLQGRVSIADGRPSEAIAPLREAYRLGGGASALRALAEACDLSGRVAEAISARRELARRGELDPADRVALVDALVRRREFDVAVAIQAAGTLASLDGDDLVAAAVRLGELIESTGDSNDARQLRAAVAAMLEVEDADAPRRLDDASRRRFWVTVGDDAAAAGATGLAAARWRRAGADDDVAIRARRLRAEAALGRDLVVQAILLDAVDGITDADLALVGELRVAGVAFDRLVPILDASIAGDTVPAEAWRLLVAIDPARGAAVLDRMAAEDRIAVAGPLVAAAFDGGSAAAIDVARTLEGTVAGVDAAVRALLAGPIDADDLLTAAIAAEATQPGSLVVAEILRRHDRLDLAGETLAAASAESAVARVARLRLAADAADPGLVAAVPSVPFDPEVERARVAALLASGEPERAATAVAALLDRSPEEAASLALAARVASVRLGGEIDAVELAARARRAGDDSLTTTLDLAGFAASLADTEGISPATLRTLATLRDDPVFRAILEADAALAAGDPATAIDRLEPRLAEHAGRDAVLVRLLAAWRAAGRLAEGRLRLAALVERHPADPTLGDALFAVDRTLQGPRAVAIDLRRRVAAATSGQPLRRLELVLSEIPESRDEWRSIAAIRLARRPDGDAARIERLAFAIETSGAELDEALDAAIAVDPEAIAPRQRRRLASVAAAVPGGRGAAIVDRIASSIVAEGGAMDVDTAIAVATALDEPEAAALFASSRPAAPWTRLDPEWRERLAEFAGRDAAAADLAASFAIDAAPRDLEDARLLRTAIAIAMRAGIDAPTILDRLDRAAGLGWRISIAWPDGESSDGRRLGAIASDASMLGREDLAIDLMELALDDRPDDPVALNNLGFALLERGDLARAEILLDASRRLDPESASTLDSVGWLRFLQGRHDPADPDSSVSLVRRSISIRLDEGRMPSAEVLMHMADATWAAGDRVEAERLWRSLAEPDDDATRRRRLAGIRNYQTEVWGGELVPSTSIDRLLEGRWNEAARDRLEAIAAGRSPIDVASEPEPSTPPLDA